MPRTKVNKVTDNTPKGKRGPVKKSINEKLKEIMHKAPAEESEEEDDFLYDNEVINLAELKQTLEEIKNAKKQQPKKSSNIENREKAESGSESESEEEPVEKKTKPKPTKQRFNQEDAVKIVQEILAKEMEKEKRTKEEEAAKLSKLKEQSKVVARQQINRLRNTLNF
jgi:hypothetical protein